MNINVEKYSEIYTKLVNFIYNYAVNNHIQTLVLGISGGIDSTVVAALCHAVCVKSNHTIKLYGVSMPSLTNATDEQEAADMVMKHFCTTYQTVHIDDAVSSLIDLCSEYPADMTTTAQGNIKARTRMIYLYNVAQLSHGIVMDTDNLTEWLTGFFTIHGDVGDLSPMHNLWKHEVYELAEYIKTYTNCSNEQKIAIGMSMQLTPTDGNGVKAGGDMAQIAPGYTYNEVDSVLASLASTSAENVCIKLPNDSRIRKTMSDCGKLMNKAQLIGVCNRHFNTEFKRVNLPIKGPKF